MDKAMDKAPASKQEFRLPIDLSQDQAVQHPSQNRAFHRRDQRITNPEETRPWRELPGFPAA
jgi:hypothetical protein